MMKYMSQFNEFMKGKKLAFIALALFILANLLIVFRIDEKKFGKRVWSTCPGFGMNYKNATERFWCLGRSAKFYWTREK